jgi:2Fe-2S ferredoxin
MPIIKFIEHNGTEHVVEADVGSSLMTAAVDNFVPGVLGDCGGSCACATCHGYIDNFWLGHLPPPDDDEHAMLPCALETLPNSRLLCQLQVTESLDGIVIRLPESQV